MVVSGTTELLIGVRSEASLGDFSNSSNWPFTCVWKKKLIMALGVLNITSAYLSSLVLYHFLPHTLPTTTLSLCFSGVAIASLHALFFFLVVLVTRYTTCILTGLIILLRSYLNMLSLPRCFPRLLTLK